MLAPYLDINGIEAGCDEAGRGCLAGPVFAAAVILPKDFKNKLLNDSKKLKEKDRYELRSIIEKEALDYSVAKLSHTRIDQINILRASIKSMHKALDGLTTRPTRILVDGNKFMPYKKTEAVTIVKGDGKYASIAAASILAKTYRDDYMIKLHKKYPNYNWKQNKGYPTFEHRQGIIANGPCKYHRMSFQLYPLPEQGSLFKSK